MAAGLPLDPERLARAAPIGHAARLQRLHHRVDIHPSHHQHFTGLSLLRNGRDQPIGVQFQGAGIKRHRRKTFGIRVSAAYV